MKNFIGRNIWITGASSGIGKAVAIELAARGANCMLTARNPEALNAVKDQIEANQGSAFSYKGDVTDLKLMQGIAQKIEGEHGPVDILIANAGDHIFSRPEKFDSEEYLYLMNLNYGGILKSIEAVLPRMLERKQGHIVGMASLAGFRGLPRAAAYGASKAAISHFLESARFHLRRSNIKVSVVNPGFVRTPLTDKNDFRMPFLLEPKQAAKIISEGILREKREITFPFLFSTILRIMRFMPYPIYDFIVEQIWKNQERGKK